MVATLPLTPSSTRIRRGGGCVSLFVSSLVCIIRHNAHASPSQLSHLSQLSQQQQQQLTVWTPAVLSTPC